MGVKVFGWFNNVEKRENIKGERMGRTLLGVSFWAFPLLLDQKSIGMAVNDFCGSLLLW